MAGNAFFQLLVTLDNMFHFTSWLSEKALGALYQYRVTVPDSASSRGPKHGRSWPPSS
ncbi:MAG: hypothetical protein WAK71_13745 [Streptosporangiaceae bacterium]